MNPMDRQTEGQEPQHQDRQPGIESQMNPLPLSEDEDYQGSGKLKGKSRDHYWGRQRNRESGSDCVC